MSDYTRGFVDGWRRRDAHCAEALEKAVLKLERDFERRVEEELLARTTRTYAGEAIERSSPWTAGEMAASGGLSWVRMG